MRRALTSLVAGLLAAVVLLGGSAQARSRDTLTVSVPSDITVTADHVCGQSDCASVSFSVTASGGTPPYAITCSLPPGDFVVGTHTDTCYAQDAHDNTSQSASFTITVNAGGPSPAPPPPPPPTLTVSVPSDITVTADHVCGQSDCASVSFSTSAGGGVPPYTVTCSLPPGDFVVGTHVDTCYAQDAAADTSQSASFTVTVNPGGPVPGPPPPPAPTLQISAPANITTTATTPCGASYCASVSYSFTATGGYPPYTFGCNLPSGGQFIVGTTTVSCMAQDSRGDSTPDASFTITVRPPATTSAGPGTTTTATATGGAGTTTSPATTTTTATGGGGAPTGGAGTAAGAGATGGTGTATGAAGTGAPAGGTAGGGTASTGHTTSAAAAATVSAPDIHDEAHGREALRFGLHLAGAATLHVSLLGPSGEALLRFTAKATKRSEQISHALGSRRVKRGSRLTLRVTVTARGKSYTFSRRFTA